MKSMIESSQQGTSEKQSDDPVISLEHVFKSFNSQAVLKDVSFEVAEGESFGLLGRSGIGKSVTLRLIIGLLTPDRGRIAVEQKDVHKLNHDELLALRKRIGFLFQSGALFDSFSVRENVAFPLRRHTHKRNREIQEIVQARLEEVGLKDDGNKLPGQLSGGMQKRVGLARALALDPPILLVDEPSSSLDVLTASEIYDLLRHLKEQRKTLILVTHDGTAMRGMADRVGVLDNGTIIAQGSPDELALSENDLVRALVTGRER